MFVDIDPESEVPLYQQLRDRIVEAIAAGELAPGEQLASVRQLASQFGINIATVGKGVDLLRQEGLVRTTRRSGSVVARGPATAPPRDGFVAEWSAGLRTLIAEGVAQGMTSRDIRNAVDEVVNGFVPRLAAGPAALSTPQQRISE